MAPWELQDRPIWWQVWALEAMAAEGHAEKQAIDRAKNKGKKRK